MGLLEELAVRCEAAMEPDRDLETEIAVAVHGGEIVWKQANYTMEMYPARKYASADHAGGFGNAPVDTCTTSLDAAMSLIPDHWHTRLATEDRHSHSWRWELRGGYGINIGARAATPALALTAASLRARHALALSKGSDT